MTLLLPQFAATKRTDIDAYESYLNTAARFNSPAKSFDEWLETQRYIDDTMARMVERAIADGVTLDEAVVVLWIRQNVRFNPEQLFYLWFTLTYELSKRGVTYAPPVYVQLELWSAA